MRYNSWAYVINHVNFTIARKSVATRIRLTKKTYPLLRLLHHVGCVHHFVISERKVRSLKHKYITFTTLFYRNTVFFKELRVLSTPSRRHTISLKALRIANNYLNSSVLIISTPYGLVTHHDALRLNTGGLLVAFLN